jgi:hypothetical protein
MRAERSPEQLPPAFGRIRQLGDKTDTGTRGHGDTGMPIRFLALRVSASPPRRVILTGSPNF